MRLVSLTGSAIYCGVMKLMKSMSFFGGLVHQNFKVELFNLTLFFVVTWFGSLVLSAV